MWLCFVHGSRVCNRIKLLFHRKLNCAFLFLPPLVWFYFLAARRRRWLKQHSSIKVFVTKRSVILIPFSCFRPSFIQSMNFRWYRCSCVYFFSPYRHLMKRTSTWKRFFHRIVELKMFFLCFCWRYGGFLFSHLIALHYFVNHTHFFEKKKSVKNFPPF